MAKPQTAQAILRRYAPFSVALKLLGIVAFVGMGLSIRHFWIEPVWIDNNHTYPIAQPQTVRWFVKSAHALQNLNHGDLVWVQSPSEQELNRVLVGLPGQTLSVQKGATLSSGTYSLELKDDTWFLHDLQVRIPQQGDTWRWSQLSLIEFDLAYKILRQTHPQDTFAVQLELWVNQNPISLEKAGAVQLYNLPINVRELHTANWQELYIAQLQIGLNDPAARQVQFKRQVLRNGSPIDSLYFAQDYFWVSCTKAANCSDSRDFGLLGRDNIIGKATNSSLKLFL